MYFKYKYFSNEKNKFIIFPLLFILIHTLHNITASIRFVTSIYDFFLLITPQEHNMFKILVRMSECISWNNE